jgi:hypothetical protein
MQTDYLLSGNFDSLSEGEMIPLSGVTKSGAGYIIHAGGAGDGLLRAGGVELQSALVWENHFLLNSTLSVVQSSMPKYSSLVD